MMDNDTVETWARLPRATTPTEAEDAATELEMEKRLGLASKWLAALGPLPPSAHLLFEQDGAMRAIPLADRIVIGRGRDADVSILNPWLSKRHFEIVARDDRFVVRELATVNRIEVNGHECSERILCSGDQITAGTQKFVFLDRAPSLPD